MFKYLKEATLTKDKPVLFKIYFLFKEKNFKSINKMVKCFRSVKCPVKGIIKDPGIHKKIHEITVSINDARTFMLQFTKLYFIFLGKEGKVFPEANKSFFKVVLRVLSEQGIYTRSSIDPDLFDSITNFYKEFYSGLLTEKMGSISGLKSVIDYMITDTTTDIENNIKNRFYDHLKKFVYTSYETDHYKIISDYYTLDPTDFKSDPEFHESILARKKLIFPQRIYEKNSIRYDLVCHPQDYLKGMFYMAGECESQEKAFMNVFPLKKSIIPGHIRIDTETLITSFVKENKKIYKQKGGIELFKEHIWSLFFRTDKKVFYQRDFKFTGSIQTDGVSATLLFRHKSITGKFAPKQPKILPELYIDEIGGTVREDLLQRKIVSIDPNKDDLIYCSTGTRETFETFRYTQNQRRKETGIKKHKKILEKEKKDFPETLSLELLLSKTSSKTVDFEKFREYIRVKCIVNSGLKQFYEREIWRKFRLSVFVKTKQSESRMIENFKKKFGEGSEVVLAFGDWSQKKQMKFKEPTKGKSFRTLFRKAGYSVFLVDEFRTSKMCSNCQNEEGVCEKYKKIPSPRPWRNKVEIICNGLVKCKTCNTKFNRDVNSTLNIREIALNSLNGVSRPEFLDRK